MSPNMCYLCPQSIHPEGEGVNGTVVTADTFFIKYIIQLIRKYYLRLLAFICVLFIFLLYVPGLTSHFI